MHAGKLVLGGKLELKHQQQALNHFIDLLGREAEIVTIAREYQLPLYPLSSGKNWGLGSRLPVQPGCVILDLSDLNKIIEINDRFRYAIIEPGVTQIQLAQALASRNSH